MSLYGLDKSGVTASTYGNANNVPQITVDQFGRITAASNIGISGSAIGRNFIDNGGMMINQRAVSATATADDAYHLDRMYALTQTASVQASQQTDQESGTPFNLRLTQNQAAAQRFGNATIIESSNSRWLRGQACVFSNRIRCSSAQAIRIALLEWTGTADAVTSDVVLDWTSASYTAGGFFLVASITVTAVATVTPVAATWTDLSVTGTCGSSLNNMVLVVWTEGTAAQNVTLDLAKWKLELGSSRSTFDDWHNETERAKCQRIYFRRASQGTADYIGVLQAYSTTATVGKLLDLPVVMRDAPTVTQSAIGDLSALVADGSAANAFTGGTFDRNSPSSIGSSGLTGTSGLTVGQASAIRFNTASGWIAASADL